MKIPGILNPPGFGLISFVFTFALFCWHSTTTSHAMSISESGADRYSKKTHSGHGMEVMEVPQSGEDDRSMKFQPFDADEDEDDLYTGSDESSSAEKARLSPAKRRLRFNKRRLRASKRRLRFQKRRFDSAEDTGDDAFDRKAREPRLRFHDVRRRSAAEEQSENTEIQESHLGNSRSRRSVNSATSSAGEARRFKRLSINNDMKAIADMHAYEEYRLKEQQANNLRRILMQLGKRSDPVLEMDSARPRDYPDFYYGLK